MPRRQWTEEQQAALNQRRVLFATRYQHITLNKRHRVNRTACPCCGYPTLSERGRYEICGLCFWEDDGQDDDDADTCRGGPNGGHSSPRRVSMCCFTTACTTRTTTPLPGRHR